LTAAAERAGAAGRALYIDAQRDRAVEAATERFVDKTRTGAAP
jgi:hypothetical protein